MPSSHNVLNVSHGGYKPLFFELISISFFRFYLLGQPLNVDQVKDYYNGGNSLRVVKYHTLTL